MAKRTLISTILLLALSILTGPVMAAKFYKWVDEEGVTHFSQRPPQNQARPGVEEMEVRAGKPADAPKAAQVGNAPGQQQADENAAKSEKPADAPAEIDPEAQAARCNDANDYLTRLKNSNRMFRVDDKGNTTRLGEEERQAEIDRVQQQITENCN